MLSAGAARPTLEQLALLPALSRAPAPPASPHNHTALPQLTPQAPATTNPQAALQSPPSSLRSRVHGKQRAQLPVAGSTMSTTRHANKVRVRLERLSMCVSSPKRSQIIRMCVTAPLEEAENRLEAPGLAAYRAYRGHGVLVPEARPLEKQRVCHQGAQRSLECVVRGRGHAVHTERKRLENLGCLKSSGPARRRDCGRFRWLHA
ncbi:hypothetical protein B0H15DRAFT_815439 [Mycena belliarum]|uniref:Uncharacterized protein n=1 Tax=Mycena belliarum TaxID=1033014 RepID=A0AAD6XWK0_9AGAR|nr:hypothetical protein B0H15DRAFT_815439 [Mycena belliae]